MAKIIAVTGATGGQGGSVAQNLLKKPEWKVRAITRNVNSKGAQALAAQGAEVVAANLDDEASLVKAFEGAYAIFGVTNFWETLPTLGAEQASKHEQEQALKLASAASKTSTLQHYIWSTLPGTQKISGGKHFVPHMDPKAQVDDYIREHYPELAKKTTYLWVTWYTQNMAYYPFLRPIPWPLSNTYIWVQPSPPTALLPTSGSIPINIGVYVSAILSHPSVSLTRYACVKTTSTTTFADVLAAWSRVSGVKAEYVQCSLETFAEVWGPAGLEMATQYKFGAESGNWDQYGVDLLSEEELGIQKGELVGLEETLEGLKASLL